MTVWRLAVAVALGTLVGHVAWWALQWFIILDWFVT